MPQNTGYGTRGEKQRQAELEFAKDTGSKMEILKAERNLNRLRTALDKKRGKAAMNYLKHSPSSYDDRTSVNGKVSVAHAGSTAGLTESGPSGADAGGTEAKGDAPQTKQAANLSTPSRSDKVPSGVDHYSDHGV